MPKEIPPGLEMKKMHVQATNDVQKAYEQYEALKADGTITGALIIARDAGGYHVLGQGLDPQEMLQTLAATAEVLMRIDEDQAKERGTTRASEPKPRHYVRTPDTPRAIPKTLKHNPDGTLEAPLGETFMTCGECGSTRWMILNYLTERPTISTARLVCAACENEVKIISVGEEGSA